MTEISKARGTGVTSQGVVAHRESGAVRQRSPEEERFIAIVEEFLQPIVVAVGGELVRAEDMQEGDIPLRWKGYLLMGFRLPGLHGALQRMLAAVEREEGRPLKELSRESKQRVVRQLDQIGAFTLRKAVEEVADALGISRFTVYNYLNRSEEGK